MKSLYRLQAEGIENLPTEGGYVLASNHLSNFDPWVLAYPLWPRRRLRSMAKAELFNPLLAPLLRASGAFPVRRGGIDREAYRTAAIDQEITYVSCAVLGFLAGMTLGQLHSLECHVVLG